MSEYGGKVTFKEGSESYGNGGDVTIYAGSGAGTEYGGNITLYGGRTNKQILWEAVGKVEEEIREREEKRVRVYR